MKNYSTILIKLTLSECEKHKCPFCWGAAVEKESQYYCEECGVEVGNYELV